MSAKPRTDCVRTNAGGGVYHIAPLGSETPQATVKRLKHNTHYMRWGVRRYGRDLDPWITRSTIEEVTDYAVEHFLQPDVPRETKGE